MNKVPGIFSRARLSLTGFCLTMLPMSLSAQTSLFQDSYGESAYKVLGTAVTLNPGDENISASADIYFRRKKGPDSGNHFRRLGIYARIGANEGLINLKSASGFLIDGEAGFYHSWIRTSPITDPEVSVRVVYLNGTIMTDRNQVYNASNLSPASIYRKGYAGWRVEGGMYGYKENLLWGMGLNAGQKTNIDYLGANTLAILDPSSNDSVLVWQQTSAYDDAALQGGLGYLNVNADAAFLLNRNAVTNPAREIPPLFFAVCLRYRIMEGEQATFNPGCGLYMSRIGAPQDVVIGLSTQLQDALDVAGSGASVWKRTSLNLTVGYKFGG